MGADEAGIIGGGSPADPGRRALGWFVLEEAAWLLGVFAVTVLAGQVLVAWGGAWAAAAPGVALFGLHGLIGLHVLRVDAARLRAWFRFRPSDLAWGLAGGAALLAFNGGYGWMLERLGVDVPDIAAMLRGLMPVPALYAWAAVLAPVVEELYFRGRLLEAFGVRLGPGWAAAITSAAFAAIHGIPVFVPAYLVFAGLLVVLRRRTGALWAPIVAHAVNNAFALM